MPPICPAAAVQPAGEPEFLVVSRPPIPYRFVTPNDHASTIVPWFFGMGSARRCHRLLPGPELGLGATC